VYVDTYTPAIFSEFDVCRWPRPLRVTKLVPSRPLALSDAISTPLEATNFLIIEGAGRLDRMRIPGVDGAVIETLKDGYVFPTGVTVIGHNRLGSARASLRMSSIRPRGDQSPNVPFFASTPSHCEFADGGGLPRGLLLSV